MMAADSLHVVVPLIVPSGMSFQWLPPCRRACSAGAFAPHFALPSAQPSTCRRLASNALGLRPSWRQFARSPARWLLQQRRRAAAARSASEGQRQKARQKDTAPGRVESQSAHGARHGRLRRRAAWGARPRQCRHVRVLRATGHAGACEERGHDRPPRRFPRAPQRPDEPGQGPRPELRFQGTQAGGQGRRRCAVLALA